MTRIVGVLCGALAATLCAEASVAAEPRDAVSALQIAAATYDEQTSGYVVDRIAETIRAKGGFIHIDHVNRRAEFRQDGRVIATRTLGQQDGPDAAHSSRYLKEGDQSPPADATRHFVFSRRYIQEYRLASIPCPTCSGNEAAVAFESDIHDESHSFGTVIVDLRADKVVSVSYQPYVLPDKRMDSAEVSMTFGRMGDAWVPVKCHLAFTAHYMFIHGSGTVDIITEGGKRFTSFEAARAAFEQAASSTALSS